MDKTQDKDISVLMSVYKNDIAENVVIAVESVVNQTLPPKEIVMVVDGPVDEKLNEVLAELEKKYEIFKLVRLEQNGGLGNAMRVATQESTYNFIARMDSDDICTPDRFEKQMKCFENDPELSVVGSNGQEFFDTLDKLAEVKRVPENHEEIVKFMGGRCPFCHDVVMMKRDVLEKAGGYQDWYHAEDWFLWIRMYLAGAKFYNIQENLVFIRINEHTYERRGGMKYYKSIKGLLKFMRQNKIISLNRYTKEKLLRLCAHVLVPKKWRLKAYLKYARNKK